MGIIELLTSIWQYIKEIPQNIVNFFNGLGSSLTFINDIINFISGNITSLVNTMNGNTRALSSGLSIFLIAISGCIILGLTFVLIDILRDVL